MRSAQRLLAFLALLAQLILGSTTHLHARAGALDPEVAAYLALYGADALCLSSDHEEHDETGGCPCCVACFGAAALALSAPAVWVAAQPVHAPGRRFFRPAATAPPAARHASDITARGPPGQA